MILWPIPVLAPVTSTAFCDALSADCATEPTVASMTSVNAVAIGADPSLLIGKQADLKNEQRTLTSRLEEFDADLSAMPSAEATRRAAAIEAFA